MESRRVLCVAQLVFQLNLSGRRSYSSTRYSCFTMQPLLRVLRHLARFQKNTSTHHHVFGVKMTQILEELSFGSRFLHGDEMSRKSIQTDGRNARMKGHSELGMLKFPEHWRGSNQTHRIHVWYIYLHLP